MRLVVTGAGGFIGSHVVRQAVAAGHAVTALLRPGGDPTKLADVREKTELRELSLEDVDAVGKLIRAVAPNAVLHLAWYANPTDYLSSVRNLDSLRATVTFAHAALANDCPRFVGVGTCLEYAPSVTAHRETDATDPTSLYASAKLGAWLAVRALSAQLGVQAAWARLFHLHGPGEHPARLIPTVRAALRAGRPVDLTGGEQVRDYLHVADVAAGLLRIAESEALGVVNVCSGGGVTLRDLALALADIEGGRELLRFGARPYAASEVMHVVGNCDRLLSLGWRPRFADLRASLADSCPW